VTYQQKLLRSLLFFAGWLGILIGIIFGVYTIFWFRPRLNHVKDQLRSDLQTLDRSISWDRNTLLLTEISKNGNELIQLIPNLLITLQGSVHEMALLLEATAQTTEQSTKGVLGFIEPKKAIKSDVIYLQNAALQLRLVADTLGSLRKPFDGLARDISQVSKAISSRQVTDLLKRLRAQIRSLSQYLENSTIPNIVTFFILGLGGFSVLLGLFAIVLGYIYGNTLEQIQLQSITYSKDQAA